MSLESTEKGFRKVCILSRGPNVDLIDAFSALNEATQSAKFEVIHRMMCAPCSNWALRSLRLQVHNPSGLSRQRIL